MHEMSIALSVIDVAGQARRKIGGGGVKAVHLKVGPLSGVSKSALVSAFELAQEGSELANAKLVIEDDPVTIYCEQCAAERAIESVQMICCSVCGTPAARVVKGDALQVVALEMEE